MTVDTRGRVGRMSAAPVPAMTAELAVFLILFLAGTTAVLGLLWYAVRRAPAACVRAVWLTAIAIAAVVGYAGNELEGAGIMAILVGLPYIGWENGRQGR